MRHTFRNRLNRVVFVGYHPAVIGDRPTAWGLPTVCLVHAGRADMDVSSLGSVQGAGPIRSASTASVAKQPSSPVAMSPKDELELSAAGQSLDRVGESAEMRAERVAQIKAAIDDGAYDTDEKLDVALSRMFDSLGVDLDE